MSLPKTLTELRASTDRREDVGTLLDTDPLLVRDLLLEAIQQLDDADPIPS